MKLSDVVNRINGNVDRFTTDLEYYVGGEHFDSNELAVTRKGMLKENLNVLGFKFHFAFQKRDVLFMARNPHLRKAGMVMFDGLCSDATYILRSKDENVLLQEYLALQLQSDHFWNYCESHKVGSVNFANNWTSIANYEFDLPSIKEQKVLAEKLWAAYKVKESYRQLLSTTDEMLKAKFQEMFGDGKGTTYSVKDLFDLQMGKTPDRKNLQYWKDGTNKWYSIADMSKSDIYSGDTDEYISDIAVNESGIKKVVKGTIFMSFKLTIGKVLIAAEDLYTNEAIMAFIPKQIEKIKLNQMWCFYCFKYKDWLEHAALAVKGKTLNKESIGNNTILLPPMELQQQFADIATQAEATKASLRASIEAIDRVIRSLINQ